MSREVIMLVDALAREKNVNKDIVLARSNLHWLPPQRSAYR